MIKSFFNIALMVLIFFSTRITAIGAGMSGGSLTQPPTGWSLFPAQSDIMPEGSNTIRLGSVDTPFFSASVKVLEGDTIVNGSFYVSQTLFVTNISVTNVSVNTTNIFINGQPIATVPQVTNIVNGYIAGLGQFFMSENGTTSILYHVTSTLHTNKIGEFWTQ